MAEDVKGFSIQLGLDTTELQSGIKQLNKDLASQRQELSKVNSELKYNGNDIDTWKKKQVILTTAISDTTTKLDLQNENLAQMREMLKAGAISEDEFTRLQKEVLATEKQLNSLNKQLATTSNKIANLSKIDFSGITKLGTTITKSVTAPILAAGTALAALAYQTAVTIDEFGDNAEKVGLTAEEYQKLNYAATIMAVDMTQLQKALIKVNAVMGDVATGNADNLSDSLALIGLSVKDLEGLDTSQTFDLLRDALSGVEDEATRMAIANEIFGDKLGTELLPLLSLETDAFKELIGTAEELGIATNEQAALAGEFTDTLENLRMTVANVTFSLMEGLIPVLNILVDYVKENVIPKLQEVVGAWNALDISQQKTIITAAAVVAAIGPVIVTIGKLGTLLQTIPTIISIITGKTALFGITLNASTGGLVLLAGAITAVLLANEEFRDSLTDLMGTLTNALTPIFESLVEIIETLIVVLMPIIDLIADLVVAFMPLLELALLPTIQSFQLLAPLLEVITPLLKLVAIPVNLLAQAFGGLLNFLQPVFDLLTKISDLINDIFSNVGESFSSIVSSLFGTSNSSTSNTTNNNSSTNNINVSTNSVDADYINTLLGGLV